MIDARHSCNNNLPIPVDLVTTSGSGLEAFITPAAAQYRVPRVARTRAFAPAQVQQLVAAHTWGHQWGFLGQPRTNVVTLNLALDDPLDDNIEAIRDAVGSLSQLPSDVEDLVPADIRALVFGKKGGRQAQVPGAA